MCSGDSQSMHFHCFQGQIAEPEERNESQRRRICSAICISYPQVCPSYSFYYIIIAILYFYFIWAWVKGREELRPEAEEDSALRSPLLFTQAPYGTAPSFLFSLSHLPLARPLPVWPVKGMKEREGREWHVDLWPFKKSNERIVATDPNVLPAFKPQCSQDNIFVSLNAECLFD